MKENDGKRKLNSGAASGAVAVIFLIIGFQGAVFVQRVLHRPAPECPAVEDTVVRQVHPLPQGEEVPAETSAPAPAMRQGARGCDGRKFVSVRRVSPSGNNGSAPRRRKRSVETFRFDPNTVSVEDLVRLGLSEKQAASIDNYRSKGGRFRRKEDFSRMYVVSDSLYRRLCDSIEIPKLELNSADSAALTSLRGIGPWYASRIVSYRKSLGGFLDVPQLLEIRGIDSAKLAGFAESVTVDTSLVVRIDIYGIPEDSLARHPYAGRAAARAICRYRALEGVDTLSAEVLARENILDAEMAVKLGRYLVIEK